LVAALLGSAALILAPNSAAAQDFGRMLGDIAKHALGDSRPDAGQTSALAPGTGALSNRWRSSTRSRFRHVLEGPPGRYWLTIRATTTSPGGETVAIYPQTRSGDRGSPRIGFVIATTAGSNEDMVVTIPRSPEGKAQGRLPIIVDVENASGREYSGEYALELDPLR
jgi:hypothetical protein